MDTGWPMSEPHIPTRQAVMLRPVPTDPPTPGSDVLALNHGGCLVRVKWSSASAQDFDAWCEHPTVPQEVKDVQLARFK